MSDSTFEYVCQTLFIHLDDKNEEVQAAVFHTLEFAGSIRPHIVLQEVPRSHQGLQKQTEAEIPPTLREADRAPWRGRDERRNAYFLINNFLRNLEMPPKNADPKAKPKKDDPKAPDQSSPASSRTRREGRARAQGDHPDRLR